MSSLSMIKSLGLHWEMYDPFLFCAHHKDEYPEGNENFGPDPELLRGRPLGNDFILRDGFRMYHGSVVPGFPVHPHRGFETVTITTEGLIDHADSLGAAGRYGFGDVQWMTAGSGIQHTEMFPLLKKDSDNPLELFQIWLNLPAARKFVDPSYKMLWNEDIPVLSHKDSSNRSVSVRIIAGEFNGTRAVDPTPHSWASDPLNEIGIWLVSMDEGASLQLPGVKENVTRAIYFYSGGLLSLNGEELAGRQQARLSSKNGASLICLKGPAKFLIVQGKPIGEPVVQYGPFVMNTRSEIQQAYQDYTETRFGGWPWDTHEPVHGPEIRRFSKFISGEGEERPV